MIRIWCEQKRRDKRFTQQLVVRKQRPRKLHVESADRLVAICGAKSPFNRRQAVGSPNSLPEPLCKNCLRSCVDVRIAA